MDNLRGCYSILVSHIDFLNAAQKEAVLHTEGPLLVLAGAGAGKTRVVTHRILEIIRRGTAPEKILAITFTNKAAKEMRERVEVLLRESPDLVPQEKLPFVSTFHSLGLTIIKENYRALVMKRFPVIYDRNDSMKTMKQAVKDAGIDGELEPRMVLSVASRQKGDGITVSEFAAHAEEPRARAIAEVWRRYEAALAADGALDFDDLLARAVALFRDHADIRAHYQDRWHYVHIDEYQDTNRLQSDMAAFIVGDRKNVCAVGDMDQCIYSWRGADIKNIMSFEKEYPNTRTILLEENYRSTKTILAAANDLIAKNQYRVDKNLFTSNADGENISFYRALNESDEARFVTRAVEELRAEGARPYEIAVLYRANFQSRALEEAFLHADIPYQVLGTKFFERAEVKDLVAYARAALLGANVDIARIVGTPPRGIGKTTLLAMLSGREDELRAASRESVMAFRALLARFKEKSECVPPSEFLTYVMRESGMESELRRDKIEGPERLENVRELIALARRFDMMPLPDGLHAFLENAALASDQDEMKDEQDAVRLMTVHASKGLEFPYVFITGLEQGLFPYSRDGGSAEDKEEERRLMYVAITRAQKKVFCSMASMRTVFGTQSFSEPSQFLADIPPELMTEAEPRRIGRTIYLE